jgi:very-short-patch-repair endonuclease
MDKSPKTLKRARKLRQTGSEAEKRLWGYLRDRRLSGFKFRRQVPVPPYIVDFLCVSHSLVVEVDGSTHGDAHDVHYDERRTAFLACKGLCVHRVLNHDVFTALHDVLDGIIIALRETSEREVPHPALRATFPQRGKGENS